jgi:3-carboxy-cis,cis-muconate cycloisomerase
MSDALFGGQFGAPEAEARAGDRARLRALLDVEAALARAAAHAGLIPAEAATAIAGCCDPDRFDAVDLGLRASASATVVVPLVEDLKALIPEECAKYVHYGATSQDIVDTAMMLVAARVLDVVLADLVTVADALAGLAERFRDAPQIGRTLLQHAVPTTFGAVCAGWLVGLDEARAGLATVRRERLAVQLGGPVGDLGPFGEHGFSVVEHLAADLGLAVPVTPWHTQRNRVGELAAAIGLVGGALSTVAQNVVLLSQTEIGELAEGTPGGSSSMPHKRNPARSVLVLAATHRIPGLVATVFAGMPQEAQRAVGRWQAEWPAVTELLRLVGGAAAHARALLGDLRVDAERMRSAAGGPAPASAGIVVDRALAAHRGTTP